MKIKKYTNGAWTDLDKPVKKYDTYTDEATTLPLTIQTSATDAVENYQVYGASGGVGEQTENLFDYTAQDPNNGFVDNKYIRTSNERVDKEDWCISEYISVIAGKTYNFLWSTTDFQARLPSIVFYSASKTPLSTAQNIAYSNRLSFKFTVPAGAQYIRASILKAQQTHAYLKRGLYKIPILNTSGVTENVWDNVEFYEKTDLVTRSVWKWSSTNVGGVFRVPCEGSTQYTIKVYADIDGFFRLSTKKDLLSPSQEVSQQAVVDIIKTLNISRHTFTTPADAQFILFQVPSIYVDIINQSTCLVKGSTAPDHYIPPRYTSNYDLFLGDSKLYEEEYVDYGEQKVYKRTENLLNPENAVSEYAVTNGPVLTPTEGYSVVYIPCNPSTRYTGYNLSTTTSSNNRLIGFCDINKNLIGNQQYSVTAASKPINTTSDTYYIAATVKTSLIGVSAMIIEGSDAPESYIPYLQPTDPPTPFPALTTYIGENNLSVDTTVQPEKVVCEYQGWKQAGSDGEVRYYHNGWVNTPPPAKPSWLADGYEAVLDAKTAPSNYYCDLAYVENGIQMVYRVYVSTDTTCQIEHPDNYISVFQSPYSSSFRGFTTYGVRYNNEVWNVATTTSNQDRGQTAYASIASQRAILSSTITNLTNASGYTFEDYR